MSEMTQSITTHGEDMAAPSLPPNTAIKVNGRIQSGLTKREYMATQICAGLCANSDFMNSSGVRGGFCSHTTAMAVAMADYLIAALNAPPQKEEDGE